MYAFFAQSLSVLGTSGYRGATSTVPVYHRLESYRVSHVLVDLGWVDFDIYVPPILPSCPAASAKFPSAQAELSR